LNPPCPILRALCEGWDVNPPRNRALALAVAFLVVIPEGNLLPIPKTGIAKNKVEKVGGFSAVKNNHTKHHIYHAFHHKLTTLLPPQNTQKM
jgi:hypothetical protein